MAERTVTCQKLGQPLPGLDKPPFPGPLGQRIFDGISKRAWDLWQDEAAKIVREQRLSMGDPESRKLLLVRMEQFLFTPAAAAPPEGTLFCVKLGRVLPALEKAPFPGALGERIFKNVSAQGYALWPPQATILMNHHGLSMADPEARKFLMKQMEEFFFGEGAALPADWTPPQAGGKGGGGKGAPAPRRK
jgi:Fe-S cluster biosynthesis and repair protein YggX